MDYITRGIARARNGENRIIPDVVFLVDPDASYAKAAAIELAHASIILQALKPQAVEVQEKVVVEYETLIVERKPSLWKRARNVTIMLFIMFAIGVGGPIIGFVKGNEMLQEWSMETPSEEIYIRGNFDRVKGR